MAKKKNLLTSILSILSSAIGGISNSNIKPKNVQELERKRANDLGEKYGLVGRAYANRMSGNESFRTTALRILNPGLGTISSLADASKQQKQAYKSGEIKKQTREVPKEEKTLKNTSIKSSNELQKYKEKNNINVFNENSKRVQNDKQYQKLLKQAQNDLNAYHDTQEKNIVESFTPEKGFVGQLQKGEYAVASGFSQGFEGIRNTTLKILGQTPTDRELKPTAMQQIQQKNRQNETNAISGAMQDMLYSYGQMMPQMALANMGSGVPTKGLQTATNLLSFSNYGGSAYQQARNEGYSDEQATRYGLVNGALETSLEKVLGGFESLYGKSATGKLTNTIMGKLIKNPALRKTLASMTGEFTEEYLQEFLDPIVREALLDEDNGVGIKDAKSIDELTKNIVNYTAQNFFSKENLYAGILGSLNSGMVEAPANFTRQAQMKAQGRDFDTGFTKEEQARIDKLTDSRVEQAVKEGATDNEKLRNKIQKEVINDIYQGNDNILEIMQDNFGEDITNLTNKRVQYETLTDQINELQDQFKNEIDNGGANADAINNRIQELENQRRNLNYERDADTFNQRANEFLDKNYLFKESYNENQRSKQTYDRDISKYSKTQQESINEAQNYEWTDKEGKLHKGILDNSNRTASIVDLSSKIAEKIGAKVRYVNDSVLEQEGIIKKGRKVNGYNVNGEIVINLDSARRLEYTTGHEITHSLEGTDAYNKLQSYLKEFVGEKEWNNRKSQIEENYADVSGVDIDSEITSDLVGEYLFNNTEFINNLSTNKSLFNKIYNEIKYMYNLATAGSKEQRDLERLKKKFADALKNSKAKQTNKIGYSINGDGRDFFYRGQQKEGTDLSYNDTQFQGSEDEGYYFTPNKKTANKYGKNIIERFRDENNTVTVEESDRLQEMATKKLEEHMKEGKWYEEDDLLEQMALGRSKAFAEYTGKPFVETGDMFGEDAEAVYYPEFDKDTKYSIEEIKKEPIKNNTGKELSDIDNYVKNNNFSFKQNGGLEVSNLSNKQIKTLLNLYKTTGYEDVSTDYLSERLKQGNMVIPREVADRFIEKELGYKPQIDKTKVFEDSEGRKLTKEQVEFYKDSDVRDIRGRLIPVFHRTDADFTVFDTKAGKQHGAKYGKGLYFSITPENYGNNTIEAYLNAKDGEYKYVPKMGYYIVQNSNQIKNVDNTNPTEDPDIRYSLSVSEANTTTDNNGRKLSEGQRKYFKDSKAVDDDGNLVTVYHTMTNTGNQFNQFNPVGTDYYRFGDQVVNYYTDNQDMSGSYADQSYRKAYTKPINTIEDVQDFIDFQNTQSDSQIGVNGITNHYTIEKDGDGYIVKQNPSGKEYLSYINLSDEGKVALDRVKNNENLHNNFLGTEDYISTLKNQLEEWYNTRQYDGYPELAQMLDVYGRETTKLIAQADNYKDQTIIKNFLKNDLEEYLFNEKRFTDEQKADVIKRGLTKTFANEQDLINNIQNDFKAKYQYAGYINMTNPYIIDTFGENWDSVITERNQTKDEEYHRIVKDAETKEKLYQLAQESERLNKEYRHTGKDGELGQMSIIKNKIDNNELRETINDLGMFGFKYEEWLDAGRKNAEMFGEQFETNLPSGNELITNYVSDLNPAEQQIVQGMTINDFVNRYGELSVENNKYGTSSSYFQDQFYKTTGESLNTDIIGYTNMYNMAKYNFEGGMVDEILQERLTTNDLVKRIIEKNNSGETNYDGLIMKNVYDYGGQSNSSYRTTGDIYVTFNSNQFKAVDNTTPTKDADIRYSLTQAEQNDLDGLQALEDSGWTELTPEEAQRKAELERKRDIETKYPELENIKSYKDLGSKYYNYQDLDDFNSKVIDRIKDTATGKKRNGKKVFTKDQWLGIAEMVGSNLNAKTSAELEKYAVQSWFSEHPNRKENLNREGKKYNRFTIDEWVNAVYKGAGVGEEITQTKKQAPLEQILTENTPLTEQDLDDFERFNNERPIDNEIAPPEQETQPIEDTNQPLKQIILEKQNKSKKGIKTSEEQTIKTVQEVQEEKQNDKIRKFVESAVDSEAVNNLVDIQDLDTEKMNYVPISNKKTLDSANTKYDALGYDESLNYIKSKINDKNVTLDDIALAERLIQESARKGDVQTTSDLIMDTAIIGTELGQKVQALSIIKRLTPEGQLKALNKIVNRNKSIDSKQNIWSDVRITEDMSKEILGAYKQDGSYDQNDLNNRVENVKQQIADQMKVTIGDKLNAWRYLSMLGNPKTHLRNIISNVAMKGAFEVKNATARTIEDVFLSENRTKTWKKSSQVVKDFAKQMTQDLKGEITGEGKFNETSEIENERKIFKTKAMNFISDFNSNMLEGEDWFFSSRAFESTFREYLTAQGIKTQADIDNNPEIVQKGINHSIEQAQIATFRQYSKLASMINGIENKSKVGKLAIESVIPFKKTPINVAKAGLSYSPLGLIKSISYDAYQVKTGNMEASTMIDHMAQGLTGTSLTLLGYALAKAGILKGSGGDDKDDKYDNYLGKQNYSINIGGQSFSLSWLSPVAMPLFVGVEAKEQLEDKENWDFNVIAETLAQTLDPLNEMSFMQGLTQTLSGYTSGTGKIKGMFENTAQNYVLQFFPTLFSQIASTLDDKKRSTKADKTSKWVFGDETIRKIMYKIPGLRNQLEVSTDIWGNEQEQADNIITRAFESFISPTTRKQDISTGLDDEIKRVYKQTNEKGVIPSIPYSYINYNGEKYDMTSSEYTAYKKTYGRTANEMLNSLVASSGYQNATDEEKAKMIEDTYKYASAIAKDEFFSGRDVEYQNDSLTEYNELNDLGMGYDDIAEYTTLRSLNNSIKNNKELSAEEKRLQISNNLINSNLDDEQLAYAYSKYYGDAKTMKNVVDANIPIKEYIKFKSQDIKGDVGANGKTISGSRLRNVVKYVNSLNLTKVQKAMLIKSEYASYTKYDNLIFNYINSQNLDFYSKASLLRKLGFKGRKLNSQILDYIDKNYETLEDKIKALEDMGFKTYQKNGKTYVRS